MLCLPQPTRDQAPRARVPATPEAATDQLLLRQATAARTILLKMLGTKVSIDSHLYNKKQDKPIVMNFCKEAAAEAKGIQQLSESGNMQQTMSKLNSMMTLFEGQLKDSQDPDVKQVVELIRNFQDPAQLSKTSTLKESIQEATPDMANALNTLTQTYKEDMRRLEQNLDELYAWADPGGRCAALRMLAKHLMVSCTCFCTMLVNSNSIANHVRAKQQATLWPDPVLERLVAGS